ncbi:MAG: hypothetical protein J6M10_07160 [Clostridia bacterium]|nr:hypothetical protein [Clostridia bacterium]
MKMKTVRVRRSNPSALALALAMMLTMLCVYLISLSALPEEKTNAAAGQAATTAEIRMEGLEATFLLASRTSNQLEARVFAARCAENGKAGLILSDGEDYCVISEAVSPENAGTNDLHLQADGLTLKLQGSSGDIAAVSDSIDFLRALATETGGLASSVENGDTDLPSVCSLLSVYRTRGQKAQDALAKITASNAITDRLRNSVHASLTRIENAVSEPDTGKIKLIHAAACAEWISILEEFTTA